MTASFSPGSCVQWRRDVGVVRRVMGGGTVHIVEFANGDLVPCLGDVLKPAPSNVTVFKTKAFVASPSPASLALRQPGSLVSEGEPA